jgi:hypothetical protein
VQIFVIATRQVVVQDGAAAAPPLVTVRLFWTLEARSEFDHRTGQVGEGLQYMTGTEVGTPIAIRYRTGEN